MATAWHARPSRDVAVGQLRKAARRREDFARVLGVSSRHHDLVPGRNDPWFAEAGVVGPKARPDSAGQPVQHDVGEKDVARKMGVKVAIAVAPGAKFFD